MQTALHILSGLLIVLSALPFIKNQHWVFRVPEFMKIQILILQTAVLAASFFFCEHDLLFWTLAVIQVALMVYHIYLLIRYTKFYRKNKVSKTGKSSQKVSIISANVYQFNNAYPRFHKIIKQHKPDIFITIESNSEWEKANRELEKDYPFSHKVTLENTYGMHFYSKIKPIEIKTHFFVADDIPSIEALFKTDDGFEFEIFAVHPPPPSPTEETTSIERDGDLLSVAKKIKDRNRPTVVIGDFNTVAWSTTSILFRKTSGLIDGRIGRGILSTFHAKYWFFRVPLDLFFHSKEVFIDELKTLDYFGSDHFPIYCEFHLNKTDDEQESDVKTASEEENREADELIEEGKKETTENREEFATE